MSREENRRKLHELLDIVLDTTGFDGRQVRYTGNLPSMNFYFYGHIGAVSVYMHTEGWKQGNAADRDWFIETDRPIEDYEIDDVREEAGKALEGKELVPEITIRARKLLDAGWQPGEMAYIREEFGLTPEEAKELTDEMLKVKREREAPGKE